MTDRETAAKLKARIDQWQAYVGTPMTAQPGSEAGERAARSPDAHSASRPDSTVHVRNGAPPTDEETAAALFARCQAEIADLKATVEREQEQSRKLLDTVVRGRESHPTATHADVYRYADDGVEYEVLPPGYRTSNRRPARREPRKESRTAPRSAPHYEHGQRASVAVAFGVLLLLAGFCSLVAFLVVR